MIEAELFDNTKAMTLKMERKKVVVFPDRIEAEYYAENAWDAIEVDRAFLYHNKCFFGHVGLSITHIRNGDNVTLYLTSDFKYNPIKRIN